MSKINKKRHAQRVEKTVEKMIARRKRAAAAEEGSTGLVMALFAEHCRDLFSGKMRAPSYKAPSRAGKGDRILNLLLSDLHFGARLTGRQTPGRYDATIEARRFGRVLTEVAHYKEQHRDETALQVYLNGDIFDGILHGPYDAEPLAMQMTLVLHYLIQGVGYLSRHFRRVIVTILGGNHERNPLKHPGRAMSDKWDNFLFPIAHALKLAMRDVKHCRVDIPETPYALIPLHDRWMYLTHGDTHLALGNPGKTIAMSRIAAKMNEINATLRYGKRFDIFAVGHLHQPLMMPMEAGTLIVNGALIPANGYADANGYSSVCGQWLWESVPGYPVGDSRLIKVGVVDDKDATLDKIISPVVL